jgi:hypothetical protein
MAVVPEVQEADLEDSHCPETPPAVRARRAARDIDFIMLPFVWCTPSRRGPREFVGSMK